MSDTKERQRESVMHEAHVLKSQQVAERFEKLMPRALSDFGIMKEFTMKFSVDEDQRQSWLEIIGNYDRQGKFPFEIMVGDDPYGKTLADEWEEWIRNQYALKMMGETSLSAVGGMFLHDPTGVFQRSLWDKAVFIQGVKGGRSGYIIGEMGSGKTDFASEEMILPLSKRPNMKIIHNIALLDYNGGPMPDNIEYASTVPRALRKIVEWKLEGMDAWDDTIAVIEWKQSPKEEVAIAEATLKWLERHPYTAAWFIDEGGFSRSKHDPMSATWTLFRNITRLSRKLKCYQFVIYQFDEVPPDLRQFATHRYRKPSEEHKDLIEFSIRSICPEITLKGVLGWEDRRDRGLPYIAFDTDDQASMDPEDFDIKMMVNYANVIAKDGAIGTRAQLLRFLEYLDIVESKDLGVSTEESDFFFLYRVKNFNLMEIERLKADAAEAKTTKRRVVLLQEAKNLAMYTRWPMLCHLAHSRYNERNFYPETLKREFEKLEKKYPDIMDMDELPYESQPKAQEPEQVEDEEPPEVTAARRHHGEFKDSKDFGQEPPDV